MSGDFTLHPQLVADTTPLADWQLCRLLLMNDEGWPWVILVPRRNGLRELHQLEPADLGRLMTETTTVSMVLEERYHPEKINVGALGNAVPQLHMHVVARYQGDEAWPRPVWGFRPRRAYAANVLEHRRSELRQALASVV